ncbi:MAG TPA: hypothetical protein VF610_08365 [Segetibacter sp.]|jgi:hypothetical protein
MVEVFKTNVAEPGEANLLIDHIHTACIDYIANFDLEDCDKILRVRSLSGIVEPTLLIDLLQNLGYFAEVLSDELPSNGVLI